jgi:1-acyl-sn-glycerol-3-phosphate acyltransferase
MKVLHGLRTVVLAPLFVVGTLTASAAIVILGLIKRDSFLAERIVLGWSRFFLFLAGSHLETGGRERIDRSRQYVFIANHISNLDIPVMFLATQMPIRYLAKAELFKIPIFKQAMDALGIVKVDRVKGAAIHSEVNAGVAAAQERGHSLIIFPEGTRSVTGEMSTFKKGAFRIAITNQLDIVPVTIIGSWEAWTPHSKIVTGGPIRTIVHDPIPVAHLTLADMNELRDQVHRIINDTYKEQRSAVVGS